jgi:hypothetical protein
MRQDTCFTHLFPLLPEEILQMCEWTKPMGKLGQRHQEEKERNTDLLSNFEIAAVGHVLVVVENQLAEPDLIPARHHGKLAGVDKQADCTSRFRMSLKPLGLPCNSLKRCRSANRQVCSQE